MERRYPVLSVYLKLLSMQTDSVASINSQMVLAGKVTEATWVTEVTKGLLMRQKSQKKSITTADGLE